MSLVIATGSLDNDTRGMPTTSWGKGPQENNESLDYDTRGWPSVYVPVIDYQSCTITLTARRVQLHVVNRRFPNKPEESVTETQAKHVSPSYGYQYVEFLP